MTHSFGRANTTNGQRYVQKLCKHWSHRFDVDFKDEVGRVSFGPGETVILESTADALLATLICDDGRVENLRTVVVEHLQRFSPTENLSFNWTANENDLVASIRPGKDAAV